MSISMFGLTLHLYGLILGVAIVLSLTIAEHVLKREKIPIEITPLSILVILGGLVGARLYHLITDWPLYASASWFELFSVWNGGLGVIGAFIGGGLTLSLSIRYFHQQKYLFYILDALALAVPLGQAVGRWGNYVNQELYGLPTTLPWGISIDAEPGVKFHPLFLYESLLMLVCFGVLWFLYMHKKKMIYFGTGQFFAIYLLHYSLVRFSLEFLRIDSSRVDGIFSSLTIAQWMTIVMMAGCILFLYLRKKVKV